MGIEKPSSKTLAPVADEAEAAADVWNAGCPSRRVLELIANKWALLVIPLLRGKPLRNNELLRQVGGISQKMLTQTLRDLELNGLVLRDDRQTVPPHVEYRLSALGLSLSKTLLAVDRWAESNHAAIDRAQQEARARFG
ncbi:DNA-binding HxlR family transcriptional regulator [Variovorax boronicumulans]|uniref:DNA-binding HxlR family transcriptional regulator n=1 Tax=Variovorax boronicumulans TaxID=436515 RepID=A0AAW8CSQ0_9BURK|nr:helix-turn-helix domain-containing protein [Variovorax boronicumulans]MDP9891578.1 DNA-binding HxlR family transcriptional regulator [Variovorax boronicumulans]MDQ0051646.1 DNA-binding HxlR family transcriptional regulator [Variovorax boronicumulans]